MSPRLPLKYAVCRLDFVSRIKVHATLNVRHSRAAVELAMARLRLMSSACSVVLMQATPVHVV